MRQPSHSGHRTLSLQRSGSFSIMRNRITIQTTEELDQALEETRQATGRQTKSEVIRDSLELYDLIVQHLVAGKHLYLGMTPKISPIGTTLGQSKHLHRRR